MPFGGEVQVQSFIARLALRVPAEQDTQEIGGLQDPTCPRETKPNPSDRQLPVFKQRLETTTQADHLQTPQSPKSFMLTRPLVRPTLLGRRIAMSSPHLVIVGNIGRDPFPDKLPQDPWASERPESTKQPLSRQGRAKHLSVGLSHSQGSVPVALRDPMHGTAVRADGRSDTVQIARGEVSRVAGSLRGISPFSVAVRGPRGSKGHGTRPKDRQRPKLNTTAGAPQMFSVASAQGGCRGAANTSTVDAG